MKMIRVESCLECKHRHTYVNRDNEINPICEIEERKIDNLFGVCLPSWCPLPDYEEKGEKG